MASVTQTQIKCGKESIKGLMKNSPKKGLLILEIHIRRSLGRHRQGVGKRRN